MALFQENINENLLSRHGELNYLDGLLSLEESSSLFEDLLSNTPWKSDELFLFGKKYITKRKVALYGNEGLQYKYSKISKIALAWTPSLLKLKNQVEQITETRFNSCLLNLYHDGSEGMSWHSDNEKELGENPVIASVSLGAERKFSWKHKISKEHRAMVLKTGSLLIMKGEMQKYWVHSLPKTKKVLTPRINLSFRYIYEYT